MIQHIITLTEAEDAALSYAALNQQDWIQNAAKSRCSSAIDEIVQITVQRCLDNNIQIPGSKEAMVMLAFEQEWIKTVADRNAENSIAQQQPVTQ
jgi:hypothetical protein